MDSIYGPFRESMEKVMNEITEELEQYNRQVQAKTGDGIYEHLLCRIKSEESMLEKCDRREIPRSTVSALSDITDAIGLRVITRFIDDIYEIAGFLRGLPGVSVIREKDYIRHVKPNGYRSYHMILSREVPFEDVNGNMPGHYYIEVQLRTLAMDSWASLEHQLKYKKSIASQTLIVSELKRCADELASCDLSMQTIRNLMREDSGETVDEGYEELR